MTTPLRKIEGGLVPAPAPEEEGLPEAVVTSPQPGVVGAFFLFLRDTSAHALSGGTRYRLWMGTLAAFVAWGVYGYSQQAQHGLSVTGMSDEVSWGLYISNFTFLVGVAAAAVMLVLPTYVLRDMDFRKAVLIGEAIAVGALVMCLLFVTADLGAPQRAWHLLPRIGRLNFPASIMSWDILVLNGYLALNALIPFYLLFSRYRDREPSKLYKPFVFLSIFWAVSIHLVTAFLYASQPGRAFWFSALLGPRFLASAFAAGPALIILALAFIRSHTAYEIEDKTLRKVALIVTGAAIVNLIMFVSEFFSLFYATTAHSASGRYLFFGLEGHHALVGWIWPAILANFTATALLAVRRFRENIQTLLPLCGVLFVAIWVEKGMCLIVPGFIPSSLGSIVEYTPTWVEISVTLGIWALGLGIVSALVKSGVAVELGVLKVPRRAPTVEQSGTREKMT